jgi:hypothetical protein
MSTDDNDDSGSGRPDPSTIKRNPNGTFVKGQTLNPKGRPAGSRNKITLTLEQLMEGGAERIVQTVIQCANNGDMQAARMVLDRIVPARKDRAIVVDLPRIESPADIPAATQAILEATAAGELTPAEGASLVGIAESHRKAMEMADLEERVKALEASAKGSFR